MWSYKLIEVYLIASILGSKLLQVDTLEWLVLLAASQLVHLLTVELGQMLFNS